jgi:hypothetical protein
VQDELAVDGLELRRLDQPRMAHAHGVKNPVELVRPEIQEAVKFRKLRRQVVLLPDVALQDRGVVGQVIEDLGRGQAVALELLAELGRYFHRRPRDALNAVGRGPPSTLKAEVELVKRSLKTNS